ASAADRRRCRRSGHGRARAPPRGSRAATIAGEGRRLLRDGRSCAATSTQFLDGELEKLLADRGLELLVDRPRDLDEQLLVLGRDVIDRKQRLELDQRAGDLFRLGFPLPI